MALAVHGRAALEFIFLPYPSFGGPVDRFPDGFGYELWVTYLVWFTVLAILYPMCRWYASIKAQRRYGWLSYL